MTLNRRPELSGDLDDFLAEIDGVVDAWEGSTDSAAWAADGSHQPASLDGDYYAYDTPSSRAGDSLQGRLAGRRGIGMSGPRPVEHFASVVVTVTDLVTGETKTIDVPKAHHVALGMRRDDEEGLNAFSPPLLEVVTVEFQPMRDRETGIAYTVTHCPGSGPVN